ncbi:MAG: hypothetical protein WDN24_17110 [Sphingomonas sp.]
MGGEVRIVFEEDGYPRELINAHDYERAIREGALTPDMDITVYRDDQAPSVFRARRVKELKPLFGIGKRASVRPAREKSASPPELVLEPGAPQGKPAKRTAVAATAAMPAPIESLEAPREPVSAEPPRAWDVEEALALEELGARRDGPSLVKFFLRALARSGSGKCASSQPSPASYAWGCRSGHRGRHDTVLGEPRRKSDAS